MAAVPGTVRCRADRRIRNHETNLVLGTVPGDRRAGYLGTVMPGYDALVVDPAGAPSRTAPPANCWCAPNSTAPSRSATSVTPAARRSMAGHGRPRGAGGRRLVPIRRPDQGRDPPARGGTSRRPRSRTCSRSIPRSRRRRCSRSVAVGRGRGDGGGRRAARAPRRPARCAGSPSPVSPTSPCPGTSTSWTRYRSRRRARCCTGGRRCGTRHRAEHVGRGRGGIAPGR